MSKVIMGIQILHRAKTVPDVQSLLTEFGCYIKTRIGLHEAAIDECSSHGLILLEFIDEDGDAAERLEAKLLEMKEVIVKKMVF